MPRRHGDPHLIIRITIASDGFDIETRNVAVAIKLSSRQTSQLLNLVSGLSQATAAFIYRRKMHGVPKHENNCCASSLTMVIFFPLFISTSIRCNFLRLLKTDVKKTLHQFLSLPTLNSLKK